MGRGYRETWSLYFKLLVSLKGKGVRGSYSPGEMGGGNRGAWDLYFKFLAPLKGVGMVQKGVVICMYKVNKIFSS